MLLVIAINYLTYLKFIYFEILDSHSNFLFYLLDSKSLRVVCEQIRVETLF